MNTLFVKLSKNPIYISRLVCGMQEIWKNIVISPNSYATSVDAIDVFTMELLQKHKEKQVRNYFPEQNYIRLFAESKNTESNTEDVSIMSIEELDKKAEALMNKNKDKQLSDFITNCYDSRKTFSGRIWKALFRNYSMLGKPDMIEFLQKCCSKIDPYLYKRNREFSHYLAKAQCMRGNSEKGLQILTDCYDRNENLRVFYRSIFKELIQDTVLNRSEASLVIFKKYTLEFSERWSDHYPLVCIWHLCWSSSWFSDQMLSNELLESSLSLQVIVKDKATVFSINILRQDYNEDAVVRLLQTLLKYQMMQEYVKVLQVLFSYKLKNKDIRGCTEILRNCDALGVALSSNQQGRYIGLLIEGKQPETKDTSVKVTPSKNFKLKF